MDKKFDSVEEAVEELRKGRLVLVMDSKQREGEGDFIGVASKVNPETVNFILSEARGAFVAAFMPHGRCDFLGIPPMNVENDSFNQTKFRVSVDAKMCFSGSSAHERATTVNLLGDQNAKPTDFVKPGHVVPIEASQGRLKDRQGHTEAGVTLVELAGFNPPVAIDLEILDHDGRMAREEKLFSLARKHELKIIDIDSVIRYIG